MKNRMFPLTIQMVWHHFLIFFGLSQIAAMPTIRSINDNFLLPALIRRACW